MTEEDGWLVIRKEQAEAFGKPVPDGFLVRAGSTAMREGSPNEKRNRGARDRLVADGVLVPDENPALLRFAADHTFTSPSAAAGVVIDGNSNGSHWKPDKSDPDSLSREAVEAAMDAYDAYQQGGEHADIFGVFGTPNEYWVRSTRPRSNRVYPTKPLIGHILNKTELNGGWTKKTHAAARLHNAGFIIVNKDDNPVAPPDQPFLIGAADRIRLCALNYFIEPARERGAAEASIHAGDLAAAMGLTDAFPNICQALGGEKFQKLAQVPPPAHTEPNPSSTTTFTYQLGSPAAKPMTEKTMPTAPTNLILYGPPGTGKTYHTAWEAVRLCLGDAALPLEHDRPALMTAYRQLVAEGRVEFATFHQSMSYEEFVEGLRPETQEAEGAEQENQPASGGFRLKAEDGIFKRIARRAAASRGQNTSGNRLTLDGRNVYKMSIGNTGRAEDATLFEDAIAEGYTVFGFHDLDWTDDRFADRNEIARAMQEDGDRSPKATAATPAVQMTDYFRNDVAPGDILVVSKGNSLVRAIGEVTGGYEFHPRIKGGYSHRRRVRWLWSDAKGIAVTEIFSRQFVQRTIYPLPLSELNIPTLERYMNSGALDAQPEPFVLIIDEINRANISKVFGELITLLEPDKRLGMENEIRLTLPYSKERFGVPANLHIIGTMNTADRSIALLDTALRRRFDFLELMPDPAVLSANLDGINLQKLLSTINERIEYLFDREHQIGHAYFTACKTRADIEDVMRHKVIPLLAEYFYEDWSRIAAVLGDTRQDKPRFLLRKEIPAPEGLEADSPAPRHRWTVKDSFDLSEFVA